MIAETITDLIGNTPLLKLSREVTGLKNIEVYAKLELFNPFGSVKDRIAWAILRDELPALQANGYGLIETSSGNTAKAIAALAGMAKIPFRLVTALVKVEETKDILKFLGADLEEIPNTVDCFDPSDPNDPNYIIEREVASSDGKLFFTSQFSNPKNPAAHYDTTAKEILDDLGAVDFFCSGLGTSGSTLGITRRLKEVNPRLQSVGITSAKADFIPGIRTIDQMREAGIFEPASYDDFVTVSSQTAIDGILKLVKECGLFAGPSSGANFMGALEYLRRADATTPYGAKAVFIACDRVEWYLSYIKERRPELFGKKARPEALANLSVEAIEKAPVVSIAEAPEWIVKHQPLIVDIRGSLAFELGTIDTAINIPMETLERLCQSKVPFCGAGKKVLFVCPIGQHSKRFAAQLQKIGGAGFSLEGGLQAWRSFGYPLSEDCTYADAAA